MAYPMTYRRVILRNQAQGDYTMDNDRRIRCSDLAGDLRRLERDTTDAKQLTMYAERAGITVEQCEKIFFAFFNELHGSQ